MKENIDSQSTKNNKELNTALMHYFDALKMGGQPTEIDKKIIMDYVDTMKKSPDEEKQAFAIETAQDLKEKGIINDISDKNLWSILRKSLSNVWPPQEKSVKEKTFIQSGFVTISTSALDEFANVLNSKSKEPKYSADYICKAFENIASEFKTIALGPDKDSDDGIEKLNAKKEGVKNKLMQLRLAIDTLISHVSDENQSELKVASQILEKKIEEVSGHDEVDQDLLNAMKELDEEKKRASM